jgi:hypothetical protein
MSSRAIVKDEELGAEYIFALNYITREEI